MAENVPNPPPGGPVPPKPPGKKETVRISLPPKPTATIKLPTLPGGAPAAAPVSPATASHAPGAPPPARPAPPAPSSGAPAARVAGPPKGAPSAAPAAAARPPAAPAVKRVSGLDLGLAIAAAIIGLGAVGSLFMLLQLK